MSCKDHISEAATQTTENIFQAIKELNVQTYECPICHTPDSVLDPNTFCDNCRQAKINKLTTDPDAATVRSYRNQQNNLFYYSLPERMKIEDVIKGGFNDAESLEYVLDPMFGRFTNNGDAEFNRSFYNAVKADALVQQMNDVVAEIDATSIITAFKMKQLFGDSLTKIYGEYSAKKIGKLFGKTAFDDNKLISRSLDNPDVVRVVNETADMVINDIMQKATPDTDQEILGEIQDIFSGQFKDTSDKRYRWGYLLKTLDLLDANGIPYDRQVLANDAAEAKRLLRWNVVKAIYHPEADAQCQGEITVQKVDENKNVTLQRQPCHRHIAWEFAMQHLATGETMNVGEDCYQNIDATAVKANSVLAAELPAAYKIVGQESARLVANLLGVRYKTDPDNTEELLTPENRQKTYEQLNAQFDYGKKMEDLNRFYAYRKQKNGSEFPLWLRIANNFSANNVPPPGFAFNNILLAHGALTQKLRAGKHVYQNYSQKKMAENFYFQNLYQKNIAAPLEKFDTQVSNLAKSGFFDKLSAVVSGKEKPDYYAQMKSEANVNQWLNNGTGKKINSHLLVQLRNNYEGHLAQQLKQQLVSEHQADGYDQIMGQVSGVEKLFEKEQESPYDGIKAFITDSVNVGKLLEAYQKPGNDKNSAFATEFLGSVSEKFLGNFRPLSYKQRQVLNNLARAANVKLIPLNSVLDVTANSAENEN